MKTQLKYKINQVTLILATIAFTGCATTKFDEARAKQIKKIAILSVEIQQEQPADNLLLGKFKAGPQAGRPGDSVELKTMAKNIHDGLSGALKAKLGWQTVPVDKLANQREYKAKVDQLMSGMHMVSLTNGNSETIYASGTLDATAFSRLSQEERANLAKAVGADAFASMRIYTSIQQSRFSLGHLSGDGAFALQARANLQIYGLESDDPIVQIQNVDGTVTEKSDGLPNSLSRLERQARLGEKAALTAIDTLVANLKSK